MKRLLASFVFISIAASTAVAQYREPSIRNLNNSETAVEMEEHVEYLSSAMLEGRGAGTEGEMLAAEYITGILKGYGVEMLSSLNGDVFGIKQEKGDTLTSRNVMGYIEGYDKKLKDHYIVIGARLDNLGSVPVTVNGEVRNKIFYGANSNASGLALLCQLAAKLQKDNFLLRRSVLIVAFGSSLKTNAGSWYMLHRSFKDAANIDAMINLDMVGTPTSGFYAYTASNPDMNAILNSLGETLQPIQPKIVSMEPVASDHRSFYEAEIPSVFFTTGMYPEYNTDRDTASILEYDGMERELEYIYNFTIKLANGEKPEFRPSDETRKSHSGQEIIAWYDADTKPTFFGSPDPTTFLMKWVYVYLKYPKEALDNGIQGRVLVDFIINEKGKVMNVKAVKGPSDLLCAEAVRVIQASPDWKPAKMAGKKVPCEMSLWVEFRLERKK